MKRVVLVVGDSNRIKFDVTALLRIHDFETIRLEWPNAAEALRLVQERRAHVLVAIAALKFHATALQLIQDVRRHSTELPVFLITNNGSEELVISALRLHVTDYFKDSLEQAEFEQRLKQPWTNPALNSPIPSSTSRRQPSFDLIGESPPIRQIRSYIARIAPTGSNVLITGETGTGKEVAAGLLHCWSSRADKPFVCINCAAIPDALVESELFGHERGAFTGADRQQHGRLTAAHGGTVFLDEVGDLGLHAQAKLLRAIETREVQRLGGRDSVHVEARFVTATNRDLAELAQQGKFRLDLLFRLQVAEIHLPPLRERREDLPLLVDHFVGGYNRCFGRHIEGFVQGAMDWLMEYQWPGNVRELRSLLELAFVELPAEPVRFIDIPQPFRMRIQQSIPPVTAEQKQLITTLRATNWNKTETARQLNWSRMTLYRKMAKYKICPPRALKRGARCNTVTSPVNGQANTAVDRMSH